MTEDEVMAFREFCENILKVEVTPAQLLQVRDCRAGIECLLPDQLSIAASVRETN